MNENIPQLATVRIQCNGDTGTALLFFPAQGNDDVYVFTAKHCLTGKEFGKTFRKEGIVLDKIFNSKDDTYGSYTLTETDIVVTSTDIEDLALLILPKQRIVELTGKEFYCQVTNTDPTIDNYEVRGFANFNEQETDRPFPLKFVEDRKDNMLLFYLKSEQQLDTYYQQAVENVQGLSGCGAFSFLNGKIYLTGIIHSYEDGNLFIATKVSAFNKLIPPERFMQIYPVKLETNKTVLNSYSEMDKNREAASARARDTIGTVNISRETKSLIRLLNHNRLVVIHGKPGVGKSALAKVVVKELRVEGGSAIITFTAEQLYCQTLKEALQKAGYTASMDQIIGSPLSGNKILVWIESFEKLIESGYEGAFNELLMLIKKYPQLAVVITIRDYLLQKFKITYHYELPERAVYYPVSEFNNEEIVKIREAIPEMGPLLDNPKIHYLLRTPYYLDKAARIIPQLLSEAQLDEVLFKKLMWEHIVEAGNIQRGIIFSAICLKRAREMALYTAFEYPQDAIPGLVGDNILQIEKSETSDRYSPSHDILEDWALIRFIKQQQREATDPKSFITALENSPAIKRAFRLWLDEFFRQEPDASASFVHTLLLDCELGQSWKDELIIVSLRSNHAETLFNALKPQLLAENGTMFSRVIHLLETGCKTIDAQSRDFDNLIPVGSGWDFTIDFIKVNLAAIQGFGKFEFRYLSIIESWSKQLPDFNPVSLPPASASAAFLLKDFIQRYQDKISGHKRGKLDTSYLKPYAAILFKLTGAALDMIKELIDTALDSTTDSEAWTNDDTLDAVRDYVMNGVMSDQICKYFPDKIILAASEDWRQKEKVIHPGSIMGMIRREPDANDFGLDEDLKYEYDFPSGYQSFFYWMFLYHPEMALDFLIPFLNAAFQRNRQVLSQLGSEVLLINIQLEEGVAQTYFGTYEYWAMYRGVNSRNRLITSLLMALEAGLLDLSDKGETQYPAVKRYLARLIKESNNVAVLGVVSSILQAHLPLLDKTSVPLLGVPMFYRWDSSRRNSEMLSLDNYNDDPFQKQERIRSDQRLHRRKYYLGLIGFVADYMFYQRTENELLFKQIDAMWASASPEDKLWKKFLFDMDARKYNFKPITQPGYENMVQLVPGYDEDVEITVMSRDADDFFPTVNSVWAKKVFNGEDMPDNNYATWKIGYQYLQDSKQQNHFMTSPRTMATIGLRDLIEQMSPEELIWCQQELIRHGEMHLKERDVFDLGFNIMDENPAMIGLSYIFKNTPNTDIQKKTKEVIFRLLLSRLEERARIFLGTGISLYLSKFQPDFVTNCWYGLLAYITREKENNASRRTGVHFDPEGRIEIADPSEQATDEKAWKEQLIKSVIEGTIAPPEEISTSLDMATHWFQDDALRIIPSGTDLAAHYDFIQQVFKLHIAFVGNPRQRDRYDFHDSRRAFTYFYPRYLLNQPQERAKQLFTELLYLNLPAEESENTDELSKFLYDLVKEFIRAVNDGAPVENFWALWECLREWMLSHKNGLLMPLFLMDLDWTENSEGWHVLDGKNLYYKEFIVKWGFNQINISIKFLSGIAFNKFMPDSISWISVLLKSQNAGKVDTKLAGKFIQKAFYKYGSKIKGSKTLLGDFLFILDFLIDKGSSKAYMLKEELIQYK